MTIPDEAVRAMPVAIRDLLKKVYLLGFSASSEGYNSEYPFNEDEAEILADNDWIKRRDSLLSKLELPFLTGVKVDVTDIGNPITLVYTNYRGETSERTITPIKPWFGSTEWHPEPQWLLTAFDHEKQATRDFALKDFGHPTPSPRAQALDSAVVNFAKNLLCSIDPDNDLDNPEEFIAWHNLDTELRALSSQPVADRVDSMEVIPSSGCVFADMGVERPVADGWLPIETAPKDGTWVLAFYRKECVPAIVFYDEDTSRWCGQDIGENRFTHWRPLPASPGASE
ncbi:hypothetical protein [Brucella pseudogrignonensis]|uniref:hypothetical protein n=1 Tax=Brucella pseudogrignonensis TaxID=419475 RepID=UPI003ECE0801